MTSSGSGWARAEVRTDPRVLAWAREQGVAEAMTPAQLASDPHLRPVFEAELDAACRQFRDYERIKAFALLEEPFSTDNGLLTPTLKVRRGEVLKRYLPLLDALYFGR